MCAIFGIINFHDNIDDELTKGFTAFCQKNLNHRGPDGSKVYAREGFVLGHSRLSIIDLSEQSSQPQYNENNAMSYNGEIYNYKELSKKFEIEKNAKSSSDTITLFEFLDRYGVTKLNELNGMFAFAFARENICYLVRDRFGVKPLYYTLVEGNTVFASEINVLRDYFSLHTLNSKKYSELKDQNISDDDGETIYSKIKQVPSGCLLEITGEGTIVKQWYNLKKIRSQNVLEDFEDTLLSSIELRLNSDVPMCTSLSGGIDSSVIYCLMNERLGVNLKAFTCTHETDSTNEYERAKYLVNCYGGKLTSVPSVANKLRKIEDLEEAVLSTEYPIWSISSLDYYNLYSEMSKQGFRVVIEGHGADEALAGYGYMLRQTIVDAIRRFNFKGSLSLYNALLATEPDLISRNVYAMSKLYIGCLLSALYLRGEKRSTKTIRQDAIMRDILPGVLRCFDRLSMKNSIESRAPFMDYRVIELSLRNSDRFLLNENGSKSILRTILNKYGHQKITGYKRKLGFASDLDQILLNTELWGSIKSDPYFKKYHKYYKNISDFGASQENDKMRPFNKYQIFRELTFLIFERNIDYAHP